MAEEIDDNEFFQQDFTTASEWEIFNARLDEIFLDWDLPYTNVQKPLNKNELFLTSWETKSATVFFADVEMIVTHYQAKIATEEIEISCENEKSSQLESIATNENQPKKCQTHLDLMNVHNSFSIFESNSSKIHPIAIWYGLREFIIIEVAYGSLLNESQFKILLSSACITANESNTEVPIFVRVMEKDLKVFLGVCESPSVRTKFDIIFLEKIPPTCNFLSGLLNMFKDKIKNTYTKPVTVCVQLTHSLKKFPNCNFFLKCKIAFCSEFEGSSSSEKIKAQGSKFDALPYGVSIDPIAELILHCTWQEIAENVIVDSANYSDLDPMLAPLWSIHINMKTEKQTPIYYLSDSLQEFLHLHKYTYTLSFCLGSAYDVGSSQSKIPNQNSDLPDSEDIEHKKPDTKKEKKKYNGPFKELELVSMLYYLFPDAQQDPLYPYDEINGRNYLDPPQLKTAVPDSLVFRLSSLLPIGNLYFCGLRAVSFIWAEFVQELRYRVKHGIQIPGVAPGLPDSRTCLLHQKLQMLNVCMERRRLYEGKIPFSMLERKGIQKQRSKNDDDSDEEFYDCDDSDSNDSERHELWNKPEGRKERLANYTLIDSDEALYIPITQDHVPKTEDQLENDVHEILRLGLGSEFCTQMMSGVLLSDMESFKAANPSGKLEDFIRWYSPRDWITETNEESGEEISKLSHRMEIPGNTWQNVWSQAKPVPAKRQKRLFNDVKEAEDVLQFLETRNIQKICELTIAPLCHAAILKLQDELANSQFSNFFKEDIDKLYENLSKLSRESWDLTVDLPTQTIPLLKRWQSFVNEIHIVERLILNSRSIIYKLFKDKKKLSNAQMKILQDLLKGYDAELNGGARHLVSVNVLNLFSDARDEFNTPTTSYPGQLYLPEPKKKEYILRVDGKTTSKGIGGPQFLRAILDKHVRLCGAFSKNTTFV